MRVIAAAAAALLLPLAMPLFVAEAQVPSPFMDGEELQEGLEGWDSKWGGVLADKTVDSGIAYGFVVGVADALDGTAFCLPAGVTRGRIKDVVLEYLEETPGGRKRRASHMTAAALAAAYPCAR